MPEKGAGAPSLRTPLCPRRNQQVMRVLLHPRLGRAIESAARAPLCLSVSLSLFSRHLQHLRGPLPAPAQPSEPNQTP
jgi:hypothetical protein